MARDPDTGRERRLHGEYGGERDMEAFWEEVRPRREPLDQRWFLPAILLLVVVSVPWYLSAGSIGGLVGGLPVWIWVALVCSALIAALTAWVSLRHWDDEDQPDRRSPPAGGETTRAGSGPERGRQG